MLSNPFILLNLSFILKSEYPYFNSLKLLSVDAKANLFWVLLS